MIRERTVKSICILVLLLSALLLGACALSFEAPAVDSDNGIEAILLTDPNPPLATQETTLKITLRDRTGDGIPGAKLSLDLTVPGTETPPSHPAVTEVGDGLYEARTTLAATGPWQIILAAQYKGKTDYFTFPVTVK